MADSPRCVEARLLAPEVAIGVAPVEERARVLGHVAACPDCRAFLADLSSLVDDLVALAPEAEPPSGFESSVLARVAGREGGFRRPGRVRLLLVGAAVLVAAAVSGGAVYVAGRADRELAASVRQTLAIADGVYFAAFELVDGGGQQKGTVFAYQGEPAWIVLVVGEPLSDGRYAVELLGRDGTIHVLTGELDPSQTPVWASTIPIAVHDTTLLRVVGEDGQLVLAARFVLP